MQGTPRAAFRNLFGRAPRVGEGALGGDRHVGVDPRIQPLDARQIRAGELQGRELPLANFCRGGADRQIGERFVSGSHPRTIGV